MKPSLNLVMLGNTNTGKSTLSGCMLYCREKIDEKTLDKLKREAELLGKNNSFFSFVLDSLKTERDRGLTLSTKYKHLETDNYEVILIDVPGHKDFMRAMIGGTTQGDCAILVLSAAGGEFESSNKEGVPKEHSLLAFQLGVREMIVAVNKMDLASYSKERFDSVAYEIKSMLKAIGYNLSNVAIVPCNGVTGENVKDRSEQTPWYTGPTLLEAIDKIKKPPRPFDLPLRLPVNDTFKISGIGTVVVGKVETGVIKEGMQISFCPGNHVRECKSIEMNGHKMKEAKPGDNIGFNILGISCNDIRPGQVASDANNKPASEVLEFTGQIVVLNHPTKIKVGYTPIIFCHNAMVACKVAELKQRIDKVTGKVAEENPDSIKNGDAAVVKFIPQKPMCVEIYRQYAPLGRFVVRDMKQTVAVGIVTGIVKKPRDN
jgi:elongation factor 1-alpha